MLAGTIFSVPGAVPVLTSRTLESITSSIENPFVQVLLSNQGYLQTTQGAGGGVVQSRLPEWWGQPWFSGANVGHGFEVRCGVITGAAPTPPSSPIDAWISMSGVANPPQWQLFRNSLGTSSGQWLIRIRSAATQVVLATCTYTMIATKNP